MNTADIIVIALLALVLTACLYWSFRRKRKGKGCCGSCEGCRLCDREKKE